MVQLTGGDGLRFHPAGELGIARAVVWSAPPEMAPWDG